MIWTIFTWAISVIWLFGAAKCTYAIYQVVVDTREDDRWMSQITMRHLLRKLEVDK